MVGSGEILQALRIIEHAVSRGSTATKALCEAIAARVAREDEFANIVTIKIVRGTHDAVEYLGEHRVGTEVERVRCEVVR
jgi:hypothetical protein